MRRQTLSMVCFVSRIFLVILLLANASCGGEGDGMDLHPEPVQKSGAITYDANGTPYMAKFERLAQSLVQQRASSPERFFAVLDETFNGDYDRSAAEKIRQQAANGDFSWLPAVQLVRPEVLGNRLGAYSSRLQLVFIRSDLPRSLVRAFVYLEEIGHHLDTILRTTDAPGDEGTIFRILLIGEEVVPGQMERLRQEDDSGSILVDDQVVEVEFMFGWIKAATGWVADQAVSVGNAIWDGASSAGEALVKAASSSWDGAEVLGGWIEHGVEEAADRLSSHLLGQEFWGIYQLLENRVNSLYIVGHGLWDGVNTLTDGIADIARGDFKNGVTKVFVGLAELTIEAPLDALTSELMADIAAVQTMLGLEPAGRFLTADEKDYLQEVFGDVTWLDLIRVKEGFAGFFSSTSLPFTLELTIYLKDAYAGYWVDRHSVGLLAHEATHVWQYVYGGGDYKIASVLARAEHGDVAYIWQPAADRGVPWIGWNPEEEAQFVQDAYLASCFAMSTYFCEIRDVDRTTTFVQVWNALRGSPGGIDWGWPD